MKLKQIDHEEGTAYTWLWVIIAVALGGILYIVFTPSTAFLVDKTNDLAADGDISAQTLHTVDFNVKILKMFPVIVIIGALVYTYLASVNEKRRMGGA